MASPSPALSTPSVSAPEAADAAFASLPSASANAVPTSRKSRKSHKPPSNPAPDEKRGGLLRFGSGALSKLGSSSRSRAFTSLPSSSADSVGGDPPLVCAFVNVSSGGNDGAAVMDVLLGELGADVVFDLKKDRGPEKGLQLVAGDKRREVRALVAGGDGTFSWVANAVDKEEYGNVRLVVVPLGTGNDMSRALGWGRKTPPLPQIPHFVEWAKHAPSQTLDVWRLEAVHAPGREGGSTDSDGVSHGARPLVCNYLSLGADAHVELQFSLLRWDAPEKYKSRMGNLGAHAIAGAKYIASEKRINVSEHLESLVVDGKEVKLPKNLQALIFHNIPSYGAGLQVWGEPSKWSSNKPTYVNDGRFEVVGLKSLHQFNRMKVDPTARGVRICQGSSMEMKLKSDSTPFQVDGEPWVQLGGTVTLNPGNPVGVLPGPHFSHASRKNASFCDGDSAENGGQHVDIPNRVRDDIRIGSPRNECSAGTGAGPALGSARPPASFG